MRTSKAVDFDCEHIAESIPIPWKKPFPGANLSQHRMICVTAEEQGLGKGLKRNQGFISLAIALAWLARRTASTAASAAMREACEASADALSEDSSA